MSTETRHTGCSQRKLDIHAVWSHGHRTSKSEFVFLFLLLTCWNNISTSLTFLTDKELKKKKELINNLFVSQQFYFWMDTNLCVITALHFFFGKNHSFTFVLTENYICISNVR